MIAPAKEELRKSYVKGILQGDRLVLSKAITLIESTRQADQDLANEILSACLPHSGQSFRLGITGVPGVGKSSFIEVLGKLLIQKGHQVAVLTVDPSSSKSGGSILGDKTRMDFLSRSDRAYIRSSPSAGSLGGVARKTREASILCEAAGYNWVLIETVGVGQSEVEVRNMVDFFLLLLLPNAGDDIQGMKKGIVEMADGMAINKAEGDQLALAQKSQRFYRQGIHAQQPAFDQWEIPILLCSALEETGFEEIYETLCRFEALLKSTQEWESQRTQQLNFWLDHTLEEGLKHLFFQDKRIMEKLTYYKSQIMENKISPIYAAREILKFWEEKR